MTALQALLEKIKLLDEKRTPGEWLVGPVLKQDGDDYIYVENENAVPIGREALFEPCGLGSSLTKQLTNPEFITTLANECAKLVKIIEVQSEALKRADELFASDNMRTLVLREAIEQAEKIAEGSGK